MPGNQQEKYPGQLPFTAGHMLSWEITTLTAPLEGAPVLNLSGSELETMNGQQALGVKNCPSYQPVNNSINRDRSAYFSCIINFPAPVYYPTP